MMTSSTPRPAWIIPAAAAAAVLVGLLDAVDTLLAFFSPEGTGRIFGTLLRDVLFVVGAVLLIRGVSWARWALLVLFLLALVRATTADEIIEWAQMAIALVGTGLVIVARPGGPKSSASATADDDGTPASGRS